MKIWVPGVVMAKTMAAHHFAAATNLGISITVGPETLEWQITCNQDTLPTDETNLIVAAAQQIDPGILPRRLQIQSTLPMGQGLGSSLAAAVAGIALADQVNDLQFSFQKMMALGAGFEPYPAAIAAAIKGGCLFRDPQSGELTAYELKNIQAIVYLPQHFDELAVPLQTPAPGETATATKALLAALATSDSQWLHDHFPVTPLQRQTSAAYFPQAEMVSRTIKACGGYGCFVSGSGPALIGLAPAGNPDFQSAVSRQLTGGTILPLTLTGKGLTINQ